MPPVSSAKATKKSAFSCEPCRRRKVKCGGEQPICQRCAARNDDCVYKLNPTLSYTQRLEERIKDLEDQLANITKSPPSAAPSTRSSPSVFSHAAHDTPAQNRSQTVDEQSITRSFRGLKIDDNGAITYHGATSFFHLPSDRATAAAVASDLHTHIPTGDADCLRRERLVSNAWQQRALENLSEIPEPFQYLLNVHWCWIQPLFNFIYRPAFTRDMQSLGPYYSHTLLNAILSHSIRWGKSDANTKRILDESYDGGIVFGQHARSLLFDELRRGICTIPTIQTLLLLSAQECSFGNTTQAWSYSGLAFRLIDHLGICVDGQRYPGSVRLSDEDVEIRHRVFWSCYFWDKIISLYLGRSPSLQYSKVSPPQMMFDDSAENELWIPFGAPQRADGTWKYPPATAHSTSCFLSMCRLSLIFNEILIHMYDPLMQNTDTEVQECLEAQEPALQRWWDELAPYLKIDAMALPALAPPSHIVTTNCLYHTFRILLFRPMLTRRGKPEGTTSTQKHGYLVECVTSATSIISIFDLFCRTFSMNYCVLSLAYSVYIAASVFLLQVQAAPDDQQAMSRLSFCIQGLQQVKTFSPVIGSALNLLMKELSALGITLATPPPLPPQYMSQPPPQPQPQPPLQPHTQPHSTTHPRTQPQPQPPLAARSSIPLPSPAYQPTTGMPLPQSQQVRQLFQSPLAEDFGAESMAMNPGVYEAMSALEPLSVRVGAIHDSNTQGTLG